MARAPLLPLLAAAGIAAVALRPTDGRQEPAERPFAFGPTTGTRVGEVLGTPDAHDPDVAWWNDTLWHAWLEHEPGVGNRLWVARGSGADRVTREIPTDLGLLLARPTLTPWNDTLLLTVEQCAPVDGDWDLALWLLGEDGSPGLDRWVLPGPGTHETRHAVAIAGARAFLAVQRSGNDSFDVAVTWLRQEDVRLHAPSETPPRPWRVLSGSPRGDWHPDLAATPDGDVCLVWDAYDGVSHGVRVRWHRDGAWQPTLLLADTPAFEGRAQVQCDARGRAWIAWEEGAEQWGRRFRGKEITWDNVTDASGPLHRFRRVHLRVVTPEGRTFQPPDPPQEVFGLAHLDERRREGAERLGVYYERPALRLDDQGTPWLLVRHYQAGQLARAEPTVHHVEEGWRIDARSLGAEGWSDPISLSHRQRDGMQRLSLSPTKDGVAVVWTAGRTDRRPEDAPRGVFRSELKRSDRTGFVPGPPVLTPGPALAEARDREVPPRAPRPTTTVGDQEYTLVFGDLHRHTDLSLCFPFYDGSLDDAYRYAMDVAELDFLGITDHTRDLAGGNALSLLWHRCVREVDRHHGVGGFTAFYSYERSQGNTDHNVISLRPDLLRPHQPPLPDFWAEITDGQAFTIPHATSRTKDQRFVGKVWEYRDEDKRPLVEVYQGCRDWDSTAELQTPLRDGQRLGFIASSDHMSTSASYACAWTPDTSREGIFQSLKERRTYAATDRIRLQVTHGGRWMGEVVREPGPLLLDVEVSGTGPLQEVRVFRDGAPHRTVDGQGQTSWKGRVEVPFDGPGPHYTYVEVLQEDGNRAWSSPLWWEQGSAPR